MVAMTSMMVGCTADFLEQDPLSFYEPAATYSTEAGLQAALAQCDKQLKTYRIDGNWNNVGIFTNYLMSDVGMYAKTDMGGGFQDNFDAKLTPTSGMAGGGAPISIAPMPIITSPCSLVTSPSSRSSSAYLSVTTPLPARKLSSRCWSTTWSLLYNTYHHRLRCHM